MTHLFVDISAHGYGHLAQTAPVLNRLRTRHPPLKLTIRSGLPPSQLHKRIEGDFTPLGESSDFGLVMKNALDVDVAASFERYRAFHADWPQRIDREARQLLLLKPDLVLSNISYLSLAAAKRAELPSLALCSLNWADIFYPYCQGTAQAMRIREHMLDAYRSAPSFLRLTPGMPMPDLHNLRVIGPIARRGENKRAELLTRLNVSPNTRLVLVAMGGIDMHFDPDTWPILPDVAYLAPQASGLLPCTDVFALEDCKLDFIDLVATCDALLTKSGYGAFAEAAVNGIPVLYISRPDWPEEPCLREWLHAKAPAQTITREALDQGRFGPRLADLLSQTRPSPIAPSGIDDAVLAIEAALGLGSNG